MKVDLTQDEWDTVKMALMTCRDYFNARQKAYTARCKKRGVIRDPVTVALHVSGAIQSSDLLRKLFKIPEISP